MRFLSAADYSHGTDSEVPQASFAFCAEEGEGQNPYPKIAKTAILGWGTQPTNMGHPLTKCSLLIAHCFRTPKDIQ